MVLRGVVVGLALATTQPSAARPFEVVSLAAANGPGIPFKREEEGVSALLVRVFGGLIVVALLGVAAVYALKRYLPSLYHPTFSGATRIKVLEARRLTMKTTLFLVELDGVPLFFAQSGDRITVLSGPRPPGIEDDHE